MEVQPTNQSAAIQGSYTWTHSLPTNRRSVVTHMSVWLLTFGSNSIFLLLIRVDYSIGEGHLEKHIFKEHHIQGVH